MSVARAQREISSAEFTEWIAFYKREPWGEERADLRAGIVASTVANAAPFRKGRAYTPSEFMPFAKSHAHRQSQEEIAMRLEIWKARYNQAMGGKT